MKNLTYVLLIAASFMTTSAYAMDITGGIKITGDVNQTTKLTGKMVNRAKYKANATLASASIVAAGDVEIIGDINQSVIAGSISNSAGDNANATLAVSSLVGGSVQINGGSAN